MPDSALTPAEQAYEFLRASVLDDRVTILLGHPEGGAPKGHSFAIENEEAIKQHIAQHDDRFNIYFQVNPLREDTAGKKALKSEIKHVVQLHVDIDDLSGLNRLRAFPLPPTAVVCSGNGYHGYWHLLVPCLDFELAEILNGALTLRLGGDPSTFNVDRVLRVPGTMNLQMQRNRPEAGYQSGLVWLPN